MRAQYDAVSSASGGSLARLPWFAIVAHRGAIRVFLRGEIDLTVDLPSGPVELSGREVTTWTERRFAAADGFTLTVPGAEATGRQIGDLGQFRDEFVERLGDALQSYQRATMLDALKVRL